MAVFRKILWYLTLLIINWTVINLVNAAIFADPTIDENYGLINVSVVRQDRTNWLRHQPPNGGIIDYTLVKTGDIPDYLKLYEPYIDVIVSGNDRYFKIKNASWDPQKPYENNRYTYYKQNIDCVEVISGLDYIRALSESYANKDVLDLADQRSPNFSWFHRCESNIIGTVDSFPLVITCQDVPIWRYVEEEGIVFVRFTRDRFNGHTVYTLYFQDLNDNILSTTHLITHIYHYYIPPWKGIPNEKHVPRSIPALDATYRQHDFIDLKISMNNDRKSTPLVTTFEGIMGDAPISFICHPRAIFKVFMFTRYRMYFRNHMPFIVTYTYEGHKRFIYTLSYESRNTVMRRVFYRGVAKYENMVTDAATKIFSFVLHLNAEKDERMYSITDFTFGSSKATVYTVNRHLAFSRVHGFDGNVIVNESEFGSPIEQFVLCNHLFYVVIRGVDGVNFIRYFKEASGNTWNRAMDSYPDLIPPV